MSPHPDPTRERLLSAALELFSERGYAGACTREIASRAGVSELTLFRRFGRKETLFEQVLASHTFLPRLRDLLPTLEGRPAAEALETVGCRLLETLQERRAMVRVVLSEMNTFPTQVRRAYGRMVQDVSAVLVGYLKGLAGGEVRRGAPLETAAAMFLRGLFAHFVSEEVVQGKVLRPTEIRGAVRRHVEVLLRGIAAKGGSP